MLFDQLKDIVSLGIIYTYSEITIITIQITFCQPFAFLEKNKK